MSRTTVLDQPLWLRSAIDGPSVAAICDAATTEGDAGRRLATNADLRAALLPVEAAVTNRFPDYRITRLVSFAKAQDANWQVPWHQDRVIAVQERHDLGGFTNWSRKSGMWHCEPPADILADMLFVRVFLDDCDEETGGMEFAVGSHVQGNVAGSQAGAIAAGYPSEVEVAKAGDILVLPMLTLHRSRPSRASRPRRVLRLDFAQGSLPSPLEWIGA